MKKLLVLLLSLTLVLTALAGCANNNPPSATSNSSSGDSAPTKTPTEAPAEAPAQAPVEAPAEKVKFTIMGWGDENNYKALMDAAFKAYPELADLYEPQYLIGGKSDGETIEKLRLALAAGNNIPDIMEFNYSGIVEFASQNGIIEDLTSAFAPYKDDLTNGAINLATYEGRIVGVPSQMKINLWFYRSDMFAEAGINPDDVKNVDDLIEAGKKLQAVYPDSYIWNIGPQFANQQYNLSQILSGNGGMYCDSAGNYVVNTNDGIRKTFEALKKLADSGVTAPINDWTPDWEKAFADGTLASTLIASWMDSILEGYAPDLAGKWAVTEFPNIAGNTGGSEAAGSLFAVLSSASPESKAAATEVFTKLFLTKAGGLAIREGLFSSLLPVTKSGLADPSVSAPHPYYGTSLYEAEVKALEKFSVFPFSPQYNIENGIVIEYLDKYLAGTLALDEALNSAQSDLQNQIGNPFTG